jgi:hypothetical protein
VAEGADSRSAAASALDAARAPRFAPLRPDLGDTGAFSAIDAEQDAPAPAEPGALAGLDIDSRSEAETSSMSAYDTGSMSAVDTGAAPPFSTGAAPAFGTGAPPPFGTGAAPTFDTGAAPAFGTGAASTFDLGSAPASDKEGASALDDGLPSAPAEDPLPVRGVPPRGERPVSAGPAGNGNELPFRTSVGQPTGGIIVPPTASAGAGEEHRLPIFESVESDWFRRGRHGASRAGQQVNSVASSGGWTSPADEGWRAAEAAHVPTSGGVTLSGLPKRVPRANLVPGTVGAEAAATVAPAPARSAATARDRLASFQRGMREGRAAARDGDEPSGEDNSGI